MRQWIARNLFRNAALVLLGLLLAFAADARAVSIAWVPVGNPGNAADPATGPPTGIRYGAVGYNYSIGKYDVTVGQYTEFLNSVAAADTYGLFNPSMASDLNIAGISRSGSSGSYTYSVIGSSANLPITYVSWGDAARFANWLQNGQPTGVEGSGTTETGAYTLNGAVTDAALTTVTRNVDATIFIPSADEWHKAAYYNPTMSSYFKYPFSSNTIPASAMPGSTPETANFANNSVPVPFAVTGSTVYSSSQTYLTAVGAYTASASPYGLYDMGGDVRQWTESNLRGGSLHDTLSLRGGSWHDTLSLFLGASTQSFSHPTSEVNDVGFRVAMIPEPSSIVLAAFGFAGLVAWLWRRRKLGQRA